MEHNTINKCTALHMGTKKYIFFLFYINVNIFSIIQIVQFKA